MDMEAGASDGARRELTSRLDSVFIKTLRRLGPAPAESVREYRDTRRSTWDRQTACASVCGKDGVETTCLFGGRRVFQFSESDEARREQARY